MPVGVSKPLAVEDLKGLTDPGRATARGTTGVLIRAQDVLQWHTMADGLDWLPDEGVVLTRADLERILVALRALIGGTAQLEPNRAHAVEIAVTIAQALERNQGDD